MSIQANVNPASVTGQKGKYIVGSTGQSARGFNIPMGGRISIDAIFAETWGDPAPLTDWLLASGTAPTIGSTGVAGNDGKALNLPPTSRIVGNIPFEGGILTVCAQSGQVGGLRIGFGDQGHTRYIEYSGTAGTPNSGLLRVKEPNVSATETTVSMNPVPADTNFNVYTVIWETDGITVLVNGVLASSSKALSNIPQKPLPIQLENFGNATSYVVSVYVYPLPQASEVVTGASALGAEVISTANPFAGGTWTTAPALPVWFDGSEATAPTTGTALVTRTVAGGLNGNVYGVHIDCGDTATTAGNRIELRSGATVIKSFDTVGAKNYHYVDSLPLLAGVAAGVAITLTFVGTSTASTIYQASLLEAEG